MGTELAGSSIYVTHAYKRLKVVRIIWRLTATRIPATFPLVFPQFSQVMIGDGVFEMGHLCRHIAVAYNNSDCGPKREGRDLMVLIDQYPKMHIFDAQRRGVIHVFMYLYR